MRRHISEWLDTFCLKAKPAFSFIHQRITEFEVSPKSVFAGLLGFFGMLLYQDTQFSGNEYIHTAQNMLTTFGYAVVFAAPALTAFSDALSGNRFRLNVYFARLVLGWFFLTVLNYTLGHWGETVYLYALANPIAVTVYAAVLYGLLKVLQYAQFYTHLITEPVANVKEYTLSGQGVSSVDTLNFATDRDIAYARYHEAGHALCYAALDTLPNDFYLKVNRMYHSSTPLGAVSGVLEEHTLPSKEYTLWMMHVLLAGQLAEKALLGSNSMGANKDMQRWKGLAVHYLSNYFDSATYTIEPTTDDEHHRNDACIDRLLEQQRDTTRTLIVANLSVINGIVDHLQTHSTIDADAMTQLLANTTLPDDFPRYSFTKSHAIGSLSRTSPSSSAES